MIKVTRAFVLGVMCSLAFVSCKGNQSELEATIASQSTEIASFAEVQPGALEPAIASETTAIAASVEEQTKLAPTGELALSDATATISPPTMEAAMTAFAVTIESRTRTPEAQSAENAESPPEESACEAIKWSFVPLDLIEVHPEHVSDGVPSGFKYIVIPLAVVNLSPYWGRFAVSMDEVTVQTEGGFTYSTTRFIANPEFPYLAENKQVTGRWGMPTSDIQTEFLIPPGFAVRGSSGQSNMDDEIYGDPGSWYQLIFAVAESQNSFTVNMPSVDIGCVLPDGTDAYESIDVMFKVDDAKQDVSFPVSSELVEIKSITEPIELPGVGTLEYSGLTREDEGVRIRVAFTFTNASEGYETHGSLDGYVIGSDGLIREPGMMGFGFSAGPGQSSPTRLGAITGTNVTNLMFVVQDFNIPGIRAMAVYSIPGD